MDNILILTEAGKGIGFGHYTRCSAIQQELVSNGIACDLVIWQHEIHLQDDNLISYNWLQHIEHVLTPEKYTTVIVDSYRSDSEIFARLSSTYSRVIAMDDYNRLPYPVHLVVNPNVFYTASDYSNQTAHCVGGKDYVILRKPFRNVKPASHYKTGIENLLITLGGSDYRKLLLRIVHICLNEHIPHIIVIDPEHSITTSLPEHITVLPSQQAEDMSNLMQKADVVISACGQTLHELAACGKSTIGILLDIDQVPNNKYYVQAGFLPESISWDDAGLAGKICQSLNRYKNPELRNHITQMAPELINRNGVNQWVRLIQ